MKQRRYILAVLLIAMLIALLSRRGAERPPSDSGRNSAPAITRTQVNATAASGRTTHPTTNTPNNAARPAGGRLQPGPLVGPNSGDAAVPATNTPRNSVAGNLPAGFIPPPPTPPVPPPLEAGRTDVPVIPPGFDRPRSEP